MYADPDYGPNRGMPSDPRNADNECVSRMHLDNVPVGVAWHLIGDEVYVLGAYIEGHWIEGWHFAPSLLGVWRSAIEIERAKARNEWMEAV